MNPKKSSTQLISKLTLAFGHLPILKDQQDYLDLYIGVLAKQMSEVVHLPYPKNFVEKPAVVTTELQKLLAKAVDLESYLTQIHQSTILAIPNVSARGNLQSACQQMIITVNDALQSLPASSKDQPLNTGGRPSKFRALDLANSLAGNYLQLTGKTPTITVDPISEGNIAKGDFVKLVHDVFKALEVEGSPEYFAKRAIEHFKEITPP